MPARSWKRFIVVLMLAVLAAFFMQALPAGSASANSAPPPGVLWFYLDFPEDLGRLRGAQLWGCADTTCANPVLIHSWQECTDERCLPKVPSTLPAGAAPLENFECGGGICRSAAYQYASPYFLLALQFSDILRLSSEPLQLPDSYGETFAYRVTISASGTSLVMEETARRGGPALPMPPFLPYFGLTLLIELIVAGVYGLLRWKGEASDQIARLAQIALINLLSYPVVWGFFPMLLRFAPSGGRLLSYGLVAFMLTLSGLFWLIFNARSPRGRAALVVLLVVFFLAGVGCLLVFAFAVGYSGGHPPASGLPAWLALLLAEAFAVLFEALLLFGFTRRQVPAREALLVSLMMNMASFVIGLLFAL